VFCSIVAGKLPAKKVFENDRVLAFHDIQPAAPVHILFIPKKHVPTMNDVADYEDIAAIHQAIQQVAKELGVAESGYRIINNCNADGGQVVFHLHYHLLAGKKLGPLNA
jgi:histidine triad (HIT) family protein